MPLQPWDLKTDDSRHEDTLVNYIIFCEDKNSERLYFESFATDKLKIRIAQDQKHSHRNFLNTVRHCVQEGKMEFTADGGFRIKENITENIWSVYDRDADPENPEKNDLDSVDFTTAIHNATKAGIKVAWSNDAFELWTLLHFESVPAGTMLHRDDIFRRLLEIIITLPNLRAELVRALENPRFAYESYFKQRNNFALDILPLLKERRNAALKNAAVLAATYGDTVPYHERNPCTMVHHLVQELLAFHV